jgi:hypothetical protein
MKILPSILLVLFVSASAVVLAQSDMHQMTATKTSAAKSDAQTAFETMKSLAGEWEGRITTDMPVAKSIDNLAVHVTMRVTSRGNVVVHEFQEAGTPLDPTKYDHPVTMLYLDADRLNLVHYCDAGNRPHMTATLSPDRKLVDFSFVDLSGGDTTGHMHHIAFTVVDPNHHVEEFTYMMPGNTPVHARFDLQRQASSRE